MAGWPPRRRPCDHQGASHAVCTELGIPFWVGTGDIEAAENPDLIGERQPRVAEEPEDQGSLPDFLNAYLHELVKVGYDDCSFDACIDLDVPGTSPGGQVSVRVRCATSGLDLAGSPSTVRLTTKAGRYPSAQFIPVWPNSIGPMASAANIASSLVGCGESGTSVTSAIATSVSAQATATEREMRVCISALPERR